MPTNRGIHIGPIMEEVKYNKPGSILDIGVGFGIMGVMFRAYTDIRKSELNPEIYHLWPTKIDGIEIFEWYRNPVWQVYSNVYIGDALTEIDKLEKYDIIYCGDVIEHLTKEAGHKLIEKMLEHCNQWVIIATPSPAPYQKPIFGNPNEEHVSEWKLEDFEKLYTCELIGNFYSERDNMLCVRIKK